jgi:hypothetical protein
MANLSFPIALLFGGTASSGSGSGSSGYQYTFSTSTTDADPGAGVVRFNNAAASSTTILYVDSADSSGVNLAAFWKSLQEGTILSFRQSATEWQDFIVQGVIDATGYFKVTVVWREGGSALTNASALALAVYSIQPYYGNLAGDITALTRNSDGSAATVNINGFTWTQNYNANGALATETSGSLTRTYNYNAAGVFTGNSGSVNPGVIQAIGQQNTAVSKSDADTTEAALYTLSLPANFLGANDHLWIQGIATVPNSGTTKSVFVRLGGVSGTIFAELDITTSASASFSCRIANRNATNSQIGTAKFNTGYYTSSTAASTGSLDMTATQSLVVTGKWGTSGAGSNNITLEQVSVFVVRAVPGTLV